MKNLKHKFGIVLLFCFALSYSQISLSFGKEIHKNDEQAEKEPEKGSHQGRLLKDGDFSLELVIFETGVLPEFRVWITDNGTPVKPADVFLTITLTRLGGITDVINFKPQADFLRGDSVVYEPHSFVVSVEADYQGKAYRWQYDNFEGRTMIEPAVAEALAIGTSIAGSKILKETINVYGKLVPHPESEHEITARFAGEIKTVTVVLGQSVKKGQALMTIESNESLKEYTVFSPIDGIVVLRDANPSEQTNGRILLSITDDRFLISELSVFPIDRHRVALGATVWLSIKGLEKPFSGIITQIDTHLQSNQSVIVRAKIDSKRANNSKTNIGRAPLVAGAFVRAKIEVAEHKVELAVKRSGLQAFRDFTVVYVKIGNEYEVRMLELGRVAGEWVEVLGGLKIGAEYVSENSYIIKADIEKSGASHDH